MIFHKNFFVSTSPEIDFIVILHDLRHAIRDSKIHNGILTALLPEEGAAFLITQEEDIEKLKKEYGEPQNWSLPFLSLPFQKKEILLAPKQLIYVVDKLKKPKRREFHVQVLGEGEAKPVPKRGGRPR